MLNDIETLKNLIDNKAIKYMNTHIKEYDEQCNEFII
jgi:hypothetical protein